MPSPTMAELEHRYLYHAPFGSQNERYQEIRNQCLKLAKLISDTTPFSREQSTALTHLDSVMFNANAAIARNE